MNKIDWFLIAKNEWYLHDFIVDIKFSLMHEKKYFLSHAMSLKTTLSGEYLSTQFKTPVSIGVCRAQ